jgi:hypothetical protein
MLEEYCKGLKLCYDCKMGNFAHKSPSKFECRFKMLHTGPEWKKDPRTKSGTASSKASSKACSKASVCSLKLHTGPEWKKDTRTKSGTAATSVCGLKLPVYEALSY